MQRRRFTELTDSDKNTIRRLARQRRSYRYIYRALPGNPRPHAVGRCRQAELERQKVRSIPKRPGRRFANRRRR